MREKWRRVIMGLYDVASERRAARQTRPSARQFFSVRTHAQHPGIFHVRASIPSAHCINARAANLD